MPRHPEANKSSRRWMFTIFVRADAPSWSLDNTTDSAKQVRRCVYQKERCPDTSREHYQGYLELKSPSKMRAVKRILQRDDAHLEIARSSPEQCYEYCTKLESRIDPPVEVGDWRDKKGQGRRSDLQALADDARDGLTFSKLVEQYPTVAIRAPNQIRNAIAIFRPPRSWPMEIIIIWGEPGTGKSRLAREIARCGAPDAELPYSRAIFTSSRDCWFEDYQYQHTVVFDDYYGQLRFSQFLQLTDRYDYAVSIKGGSAPFLSKRIIFTSNQDPYEWYSAEYLNNDHELAFRRRITKVIHLTAGNAYTGGDISRFYDDGGRDDGSGPVVGDGTQ